MADRCTLSTQKVTHEGNCFIQMRQHKTSGWYFTEKLCNFVNKSKLNTITEIKKINRNVISNISKYAFKSAFKTRDLTL